MQNLSARFTIQEVKVQFALLIEKTTSYFWIIPTLIIVIINILLFVLKMYSVETDLPALKEVFFLRGTPDGARQLLGSISTSIMTVVGVMFSIIIVVIQQMSNQYTPRVVSNFTRSTMAQVVLGLYVGTYIYCLILLMNIEDGSQGDPVPRIAVAFSAFLAILCLLFLVLYIHHVTRSIQSTDIITKIAKETIHSLKNVIKDREAVNTNDDIRNGGYSLSTTFVADRVGYVETINWAKIARKIDIPSWEIEFHVAAGDFVQKRSRLFTIWSDQEINVAKNIERHILINDTRTTSQDPVYGLQKLTDIALKALSPGINDPSTAVEAIHSITAIIADYIELSPFKTKITLARGKVIEFVPWDLDHILHQSFGAIISFSKDHKEVLRIIEEEISYLMTIRDDHLFEANLEVIRKQSQGRS